MNILRNSIILLFTTIIFFCSQLCKAQAATTDDDSDLDLILPIIAKAGGPWAIESLWEQYAPLCQPNINGNLIAPYPSKKEGDSSCNDGDMTLFNGLLCASGDQRGCDAVKRAQSPDGRFWRSPGRALTNNWYQGDNGQASFSPDMDLGVQLYVAVTKILRHYRDGLIGLKTIDHAHAKSVSQIAQLMNV